MGFLLVKGIDDFIQNFAGFLYQISDVIDGGGIAPIRGRWAAIVFEILNSLPKTCGIRHYITSFHVHYSTVRR